MKNSTAKIFTTSIIISLIFFSLPALGQEAGDLSVNLSVINSELANLNNETEEIFTAEQETEKVNTDIISTDKQERNSREQVQRKQFQEKRKNLEAKRDLLKKKLENARIQGEIVRKRVLLKIANTQIMHLENLKTRASKIEHLSAEDLRTLTAKLDAGISEIIAFKTKIEQAQTKQQILSLGKQLQTNFRKYHELLKNTIKVQADAKVSEAILKAEKRSKKIRADVKEQNKVELSKADDLIKQGKTLNSQGETDQAVNVLKKAYEKFQQIRE